MHTSALNGRAQEAVHVQRCSLHPYRPPLHAVSTTMAYFSDWGRSLWQAKKEIAQ